MELHIEYSCTSSEGKHLFSVKEASGNISIGEIHFTSPNDIFVGNKVPLGRGLKWYLDDYPQLPIENYRDRAVEILIALKDWGKLCFKSLFTNEQLKKWFLTAYEAGLETSTIKIICGEPSILSWPWEALYCDELGFTAQYCKFERQIPSCDSPTKFCHELPNDTINVLYIISRPFGNEDLDFQSLARPLIDYITESKQPVQVDLLRPPSFGMLREVLTANPNYYHIVHFDGHGTMPVQLNEQTEEKSGYLVFERSTPNGIEGEAISAALIGNLLGECNVPYVVLNACQSATMDEDSKEPFSAVAANLLNAGVHGIIAMSYVLWENGAKIFLTDFYKKLFATGDMTKAICAGRLSMYRNNRRESFVGTLEFNDWIVPVLYRQSKDIYSLPILSNRNKGFESNLPSEVQKLTLQNFVGRSAVIHRLERIMQYQPQAGILVHGLAGEGKTTLAKGYLHWLESTGGLENGALWFNFEGIYNANTIINKLVEDIIDLQAVAQRMENKLSALVNVLRVTPLLIVWDNFESASSLGGLPGKLSDNDRKILLRLLRELHGGAAKVLITSRSNENWLDEQACFKIHLDGLHGEGLWQYCNIVKNELKLAISPDDPNYILIVEKLDGNPLLIRIVLAQLKNRSLKGILNELDTVFYGVEDDADSERLQKALSLFYDSLDEAFIPTLRLLGLHDNFAIPPVIDSMLGESIHNLTEITDSCFDALANAGLCHPIENIYKLHPVLHSSLLKLYPSDDSNKRIFAEAMCEIIALYTPMELHKQYGAFTMMGANFRHALKFANEFNMNDSELVLTQGLAVFAENMRNFHEAEELFRKQAELGKMYKNKSAEAGAYHQLGSIACKQQFYGEAKAWHEKSLPIFKKIKDKRGMGQSYHQFGIINYMCGNHDIAVSWCKKSIKIDKSLGDMNGVAQTHHLLGSIAYERKKYDKAEYWYNKTLAYEIKNDNESSMAGTYHSLGGVALMKENYPAAEDYYRKSLELNLKYEDEYDATGAYYGLGRIADAQKDYETAEYYYKQTISILLKYNDYYRLAISYAQLGSLSVAQKDYITAAKWYGSALTIYEQIDDPVNEEIVRDALNKLQIVIDENAS